MEASAFSLSALYEGEHNNATGLVSSANQRLEEAADIDEQLKPVCQLLEQAKVHIEEAALELRHYQDELELDPAELDIVEERLSKAISLAKKHQVPAADLWQHHQKLNAELDNIVNADKNLEQLDSDRQQAEADYRELAQKLSSSREKRR